MELEALKSKFNETLGSTKLQISERTLDGLLQDALAEIGDDDSRATEDFFTRKVELAKTIAGQINHDVSARIKDWEKQNPKPKPAEKPTEEDETPQWFVQYKNKMEAKVAELEQARKEDLMKSQRKNVLSQVKESFKAKLETAGITANAFVLKQTLRDIEIPEQDADVKALVKDLEKAYYANLKEAGFETEIPRRGNGGGFKPKNVADDYWAKKKAKEGWGGKD